MRVVDEADRVSHAAVMDAFRRRDPAAVRARYREYGRLVYSVAYRVLGRRDLAEDAVQQTFVNAWQAADRFDVTRDPASWLATIARRSATDVPAVVSLPPDLGSVEAVWHVRRAIDELAPDEAAVVRLQHLDGMTHSE